ncbi:resolvase [Vibrio phage 1.170.O._10N.261.52.C3]|nr:resolvase [Vibrio phage 1.170.O._10N.261.52.C3]
MAKKYVTYKRVSTKRQGESGLGLEAQQRDLKLYFDTYAGEDFEVLGEFTDVDSGTNDSRVEYLKALEMVKSEGATLIVAKLDRISRKVSTIACLIEEIDFKVASMPNADKFQLHLYAALSEQERDFISLRTKAALSVKKSQGVLLGGANPKQRASFQANRLNHKSYRNNQKALEKAQPIVSEVTKMVEYSKDGLTQQEITDNLNSKGIKTASGKEWTVANVSKLIKKHGIPYKKKSRWNK